jgi:hypothetical protein
MQNVRFNSVVMIDAVKRPSSNPKVSEGVRRCLDMDRPYCYFRADTSFIFFPFSFVLASSLCRRERCHDTFRLRMTRQDQRSSPQYLSVVAVQLFSWVYTSKDLSREGKQARNYWNSGGPSTRESSHNNKERPRQACHSPSCCSSRPMDK